MRNLRITSYNVCYTKLLRDMTPSAHFSGEVGVIPIANAGVISFGGGTDRNNFV